MLRENAKSKSSTGHGWEGAVVVRTVALGTAMAVAAEPNIDLCHLDIEQAWVAMRYSRGVVGRPLIVQGGVYVPPSRQHCRQNTRYAPPPPRIRRPVMASNRRWWLPATPKSPRLLAANGVGRGGGFSGVKNSGDGSDGDWSGGGGGDGALSGSDGGA